MIEFYDSVDASRLPGDTAFMAGYVDGRWPSLAGMRRRFPHASWLSVAVQSTDDAMVLDVESGDASPVQAAGWVRRQHRAAVLRPCLYLSLARIPELERALAAAKIPRSTVRIWSAHYTGHAHICSSACGVPMEERPGATQFLSDQERDIDVSLSTAGWFNAVRHDYLHRGH
jgi:hypothetical protein